MRLDKYLKVSRLIKRRSVAKTASLSDRILVNGRLAKPSKEVNIGDTLEITYGTKVLVVKVTALVVSTKKADASLMYELICEKNIEQES